ncbi:hypothetical protein J2S49_001426 [Arcanobacterium wilhelmae]|uniref:DUF3499 domain-containing protein n=2 Tax=Arcanobacterium wilhelmae TaxID=1803177 RepID=A0ABT9NCA1_9ACTO|nr:hypothetical protein [Arcanobacterium wilhelmae]
MTYGYDEATAVIGPLSPLPQPGTIDLCAQHAQSVTMPVGWQVIRLQTEFEEAPPSSDDLLALADAIREASRTEVPPPVRAQREVRRPTDVPRHVPRPRLAVINGEGEDDGPAGPEIHSVEE